MLLSSTTVGTGTIPSSMHFLKCALDFMCLVKFPLVLKLLTEKLGLQIGFLKIIYQILPEAAVFTGEGPHICVSPDMFLEH